jgi:selenocysteine-specific elongation factor
MEATPIRTAPDVARRPHRIVTTAGHVDHGKSTLLRALTGMEPDRLAEERRRGLSIELGFVWGTLPGTVAAPGEIEVAYIDVPGHERFVGTMLAGVGPAPATLLVVAADDGWSAQTQEHAEVLSLLGIPVIATAITKCDTVPADHLDDVHDQVQHELARLVLDGGAVVRTDAVAGTGLDELRSALRDALARLPHPTDRGRPRLWVDRRFTVTGSGTVVTGTLTGGSLHVGDRPRLLPQDLVARVRGLASLGGDVQVASPGERVAVNLGGVDREAVTRGDALVGGDGWRSTDVVDGWLRVLEGREVGSKGAWHAHVGSARTTARVLPLTGTIGRARDATPGAHHGAVRLSLDRHLPLATGDVIVLRDAGRRRTVGRIVVADPLPGPLPRERAARRARAALIEATVEAPDGPARARALVRLAGGTRPVAELVATIGWSPDDPLASDLVVVGDHVVTTDGIRAWVEALATLGAGSHPRGTVVPLLFDAGAPQELVDDLLAHLLATGQLVAVDTGVALPQHADDESARREARRQAVVDALAAEPFAPPALESAAAAHGADGRDLAALVQTRAIVRAGKVAFAASAVEEAAEALRAAPFADRPFTATEAREALPTSRKYLIPLLEHLARSGVTTFDGVHHRLR